VISARQDLQTSLIVLRFRQHNAHCRTLKPVVSFHCPVQ